VDVGRNIIHGSDSVQSAEKEIGLWFTEAKIAKWRSVQTEWVYEEEEEVQHSSTGNKINY
jgi:nucleoside-diphosphate kinase